MIALLAHAGLSVQSASSERAFHESYLNVLAGKDTTKRATCASCHMTTNGFAAQKSSFLKRRSGLSREAWANELKLQAKCGICHVVPDPSNLPRQSWIEAMARMEQIMDLKQVAKPTADELQDILHFYLTFSREHQPLLAEEPDPAKSPVKFAASALGNPMSPDSRERPVLGHVDIIDLDKDGRSDVLVCDTKNSAINWIHLTNGVWREATLAKVPYPAHTQVVVANPKMDQDIVVACLGALGPSDKLTGSVVLLVNDGAMQFAPVTLLDGISRVADVEPADFDGDGDIDFVVGAYGYILQGEIGWLENQSSKKYLYHPIVKKTGVINVLPIDINRDGRLDFVALFAQEHEEVSVFINDGKGGFQEHVLYKAATPSFGSSGIQLVDLNKDGDMDILYTNGDNMDLATMIPRPYHGVQWLENIGNLNFVWHDILRFYGAYCAVAGDLNNDGHLDIVVTSMFNDWSDLKRASLLWLENDGRQHFKPHTIARQPVHLISAALGDIDGDGWTDIVACGMNGFPFDRMSRITLWKNRHTKH